MKASNMTILLFLTISASVLQAGNGEITGTVMDTIGMQPLSNVSIQISNNGGLYLFKTNDAGIFYANNLPSGTYTVDAIVNNKTFRTSDVVVFPDKSTLLNIQANTLIAEEAIVINLPKGERIIIDPLDPNPIGEIKVEDIENGGLKTVKDIAALSPMLLVTDDEIHSAGARGGNTIVMIDGMKIIGSTNVPAGSISYFRSYVGGLPAKYGDCSGGMIIMETKSYFNN